jgi:hypothetical protein
MSNNILDSPNILLNKNCSPLNLARRLELPSIVSAASRFVVESMVGANSLEQNSCQDLPLTYQLISYFTTTYHLSVIMNQANWFHIIPFYFFKIAVVLFCSACVIAQKLLILSKLKYSRSTHEQSSVSQKPSVYFNWTVETK